MVKLALDTNRDAVEDLEEALSLLQEAITRRKATVAIERTPTTPSQKPSAQELVEETAIDTPFFKVTVQSDEEEGASAAPTLNQLLSTESITETELEDMFKAHGVDPAAEKKQDKKAKEETTGDAFIEIVEFDDEPQ